MRLNMTKYPMVSSLKKKHTKPDAIILIVEDYVGLHKEGISQSDLRKDLSQYGNFDSSIVDATLDFLIKQKRISRINNHPRGKLIKNQQPLAA